jgi:hypothetical protein
LRPSHVQEVEREVDEGEEGGRRGRKRKIEVLEYQYDRDAEGEEGGSRVQ